MIDLTPLDVRKKKGDFAKALRGYDQAEVDTFLDLVAERLEELVRENITLRERSDRLLEQVSSQEGRERAVQEALVTAQELREEVQAQAEREADLIRKEAEGEARRIVLDAERDVKERRQALEELERKRIRFLKSFRALLERELDVVEVEEGRAPVEDVEVELDLGGGRPGRPGDGPSGASAPSARDGAHGAVAGGTDVPAQEDAGADHGGGPEEERSPGLHVWRDDEEERPPLDAPVHELAESAAVDREPPTGDPLSGDHEGSTGAEPAASGEPDGAGEEGDRDELWLPAMLREDDEEGGEGEGGEEDRRE